MPKISVILTSYNHDKYIHEAINSILNQTFTDFELLILDDASCDNSWNLINQYSDSRIKAFRSEKSGEVVYRINNAIVELALGEYIAIHHSDDVWALDKLEKQVAFLDANQEVGAVFTWVQIINEHGEEKENDDFNQENKTRWQWLQQLFAGDNHLNHPSVLIRKQCYQDVGGYRYDLVQTPDAEMWSRVLIKYPIHVIQERLTKHRRPSDHSNTSGPRVDAEIRTSNEWNIIRENFLALMEFEEIVAIFPSLERYRNPAGCDSPRASLPPCGNSCCRPASSSTTTMGPTPRPAGRTRQAGSARMTVGKAGREDAERRIWTKKHRFLLESGEVVDLAGLEPATFSMSRKRSNQLS